MSLKKMVTAALLLALGFVLPFLTGQIPQIGSMLLPMHIPVLLCGFLCGPVWGAAAGFLCPLLRSLLLGLPPMIPTGLCMTFELAAYGAAAGLFSRLFPKNTAGTLAALILSMLAGRAVWGLVSWAVFRLFTQKAFSPALFFSGAFLNAWPGILLQLALIPALLTALRKAKLTEEKP